MKTEWNRLIPILLRCLSVLCAFGVVFFATLTCLALANGSPLRTVLTFVFWTGLQAFACLRARRWLRAFTLRILEQPAHDHA